MEENIIMDNETFNIMFDDLKPEVQKELLEFLDVTEDEINKEIYTITIIEKPEPEEDWLRIKSLMNLILAEGWDSFFLSSEEYTVH